MKTRTTYRAVLLLLTLVALAQDAYGQDSAQYQRRAGFGVFGGLSLDQQYANVVSLPGTENCGSVFTHGFGTGPDLGLYYRMPLSSEFWLDLRGAFRSQHTTFNADEFFPLAVNGMTVQATDRHSLQATLSRVALQPVVEYPVFGSLSVIAGVEIAYALSGSFSQTETLTQPLGSLFVENNSRSRNAQSGQIAQLSKVGVSAILGSQLRLPLNRDRTLHAVPTASFSIGLTPIVRDVSWSSSSFAIGVGIEYAPLHVTAAPPPPPPPPPPPLPPAAPRITAAVSVSGLDSAGQESAIVELRVEEISQTETAPIVPYLFFDANSAHFPSRYAMSADSLHRADPTQARWPDRLQLYAHVLDVLGARLRAHPDAELTIAGYTDGNESKGSPTLAIARAETVADYLHTIWGISNDRLHRSGGGLPSHPSPVQDTDGMAENRRVEFASDDPAILGPILIVDTVRSATPPAIRIRPNVTAEAGLRDWHIDAIQNGTQLAHYEGTAAMPSMIEWDLAADQQHIPRAPGRLDFELHASDRLGTIAHGSVSIPVEQRTLRKKREEMAGDYRFERFSLILFDFNSSEMTSANETIVRFIRSHITPTTQVSITGYCDRIGDASLNQVLSLQRARAAALRLGTTNAVIVGKGSASPLFDNNLPEGRIYNRTVEVVLRTPLTIAPHRP